MQNILIVDDSRTIRTQLRQLFIKNGFQVAEAEHGLEGLNYLRNNKADVIICDINMPEMDGITMCENYYNQNPGHSIPIFMLTTESSPEMKALGKSFGVRAWVTKPFSEEKLVQAVKKVLGHSHG